jgi:hypothetical protein
VTKWTVYARDVQLQPDVQLDFEWLGPGARPQVAARDVLDLTFASNDRAGGTVLDPDPQAGLIDVAGVRWAVRIARPAEILMPHPTSPGAAYSSWIVVTRV